MPDTTPTTTRAAVLTAFGGTDLFTLADVPVAAPGPGQVRLRVTHSAVNPIDLGTRRGRTVPVERARFPMVLGWDAEGAVDAIGPGVTDLRPGDAVFTTTPQPATQHGTHADLVVVDAEHVAPAPPGWIGGAAAALGLSGVTAHQAVDALDLRPGDTLLVDNPVGFVGRLAVQIARTRGATVIVTTTPDRARRAAQDADHVVTAGGADATREIRGITGGGADAALDLLGGDAAVGAFAAVRDGGRYATVVPSWWIPGGPFEPARGITPRVIENHPDRRTLTALAALATAGRLRFDIAATHPLSELGRAHDALDRPGVDGKIVVRH